MLTFAIGNNSAKQLNKLFMEKFYNVVIKHGDAMRIFYIQLHEVFSLYRGRKLTNYVLDVALGNKRKDLSFFSHSRSELLKVFFLKHPYTFDDNVIEIFVVDDDNSKIVYKSKIE